MTFRGIIVACIGATLLAGCASYSWYKPGAGQAELKRDTYECEKDMRQSAYFGRGLVGAINASDFYDRCMGARGWIKERN